MHPEFQTMSRKLATALCATAALIAGGLVLILGKYAWKPIMTGRVVDFPARWYSR